MPASEIFTPDFKPGPYWWDSTPRPDLGTPSLPARADAVVVGSGYTGLHAALKLARAGRQTLVVDAEAAGWGCSTRNGGQVGTSVKPSFAALAKSYGAERANRILQEGRRSLDWLGEFIQDEGIDCGFRVCGRFHAAHSARQIEKLAARAKEMSPAEVELVPRGEQRREIGTDLYHGGVVHKRHAALDPAAYHHGLLERAIAAGVEIVPHRAVTAIDRQGSGFRVTTQRGSVDAGDVAIATNGYSGGALPWLRRRIIPIGSYIIATETIPQSLMRDVLPTGRIVSDTRKVVYYYRASPDRSRILFGGRVSWNETDPRASAPLLRHEMVRLFPQLGGVRVSHSWMGFVAYTFDTLMHVGQHDGVHFAAGYCGSGVGMASYLGMKLGLRVLSKAEGATPFAEIGFPSRPYYFGRPWFLAPAITLHRWMDRLT